MKNILYIIKSLFLRQKENREIKHYPFLTEFLKNNHHFRSLAWKFHHFKGNILKKF